MAVVQGRPLSPSIKLQLYGGGLDSQTKRTTYARSLVARYYGRYSCRRRGERAKLIPPPEVKTESDYRREFKRTGWVACIKRIYEITPLECPKCTAQMRIIAFIQDAHSIKDIMKSQGIADFRAAPPPIPKFIDISHAIDELPSYDSFDPLVVSNPEPSPDDL